MSFSDKLKKYPASQIVRIIGCKERIAYYWKSGDRIPEEWMQRLILEELKRRS